MIRRNKISVVLEVILIVISLSLCGTQIYSQQNEIDDLRMQLHRSQQSDQLSSND